jgi:hypothetical protein
MNNMTASLRNAGSRRNAPQRPDPKRAVLCSPLGAVYVNQFVVTLRRTPSCGLLRCPHYIVLLQY